MVTIALAAVAILVVVAWLGVGGEWYVTSPWFRKSEKEAGFWYCAIALLITVLLAFPGGWMFLMGLWSILGGWLYNDTDIKGEGVKLLLLGLLPLGAAGFLREYLLPRLWSRFFDT